MYDKIEGKKKKLLICSKVANKPDCARLLCPEIEVSGIPIVIFPVPFPVPMKQIHSHRRRECRV
jgi:hypothetical protein